MIVEVSFWYQCWTCKNNVTSILIDHLKFFVNPYITQMLLSITIKYKVLNHYILVRENLETQKFKQNLTPINVVDY